MTLSICFSDPFAFANVPMFPEASYEILTQYEIDPSESAV
jgi:hypothetical protein